MLWPVIKVKMFHNFQTEWINYTQISSLGSLPKGRFHKFSAVKQIKN